MRETFVIGDAITAFERTTDFAEWNRDEFTPGDVVRVDADGAVIEEVWPPRRELRLDPSLLEHVDR